MTHCEANIGVEFGLGTLSKKKNDIIWEFFPNVGPPPPPFWEPLIIMALLGPKMAEHGKLADVPKRSKRAQNDPR